MKGPKYKNAEQVDQINWSGISNGTMLSVWGKSVSVKERTQESANL